MPVAQNDAAARYPGSIDAVVVVATFRRPAALAETLASLAVQVPATRFAVVVVENDADARLGLGVAKAAFNAGKIIGLAVVEARRGNVYAINAGFEAALAAFPDAEYFLMIDDDEVASPHWLARLVDAAEATGADVIGGPVVPRFQDGVPRYLTGHPVFWPIDAKTGPLPMIYGSGNCLMRRRVFATLGAPAFDPQFNFLGGGDTDFFTRAKLAGLSFYWVADALVTESVPIARTRAKWVLRRSLRIGAINRRLDRKRNASAPGAVRVALKDLAILCLAPARMLRDLVRTGNPFISLHPLAISLGRLTSAFGFEVEQYKSSK
jgi:GT2 family glycosyltransferase